MKTIKNLSMSLEPLQNLKLLYQYYLFIMDQQPVYKDQQHVCKDQVQVQILVMKTVSFAMSTVHRVKTQEEQSLVQIGIFQPMMNMGQWRLKHTSMPQEPDNFFRTTRNGDQQDRCNLTTMPCVQRSLYLHEVTNNFSNFQVDVPKEVDGQTRDVLEQM